MIEWLNNIQVMGKTEAEEAFRPWWDSLSDYILWVSAFMNKLDGLLDYIQWVEIAYSGSWMVQDIALFDYITSPLTPNSGRLEVLT